MRSSEVHIAVSTNKGAYILSSDEGREKWETTGPFLSNEDVNNIASDRGGRLYASTLTDGVFVSDDAGKTWKPSNKGLHVKKVWNVEPDPHEEGSVYAGTHYGHLFRSKDSGDTWTEVSGLHEAPLRNEWGVDWGFGTIGLALHTVRFDPKQKGKMYVVSSGAGPYLSMDYGETWTLLRNGVNESCPRGASDESWETTDVAEREKQHLDNVHKCTHKLAISSSSPGTVFQQNHCGVFVSTDSGGKWTDISIAPEIRHGFAITLAENGRNSLFVIPAYQDRCQKHNSCILGPLEVYRTGDSGKNWKSVSNGLPADTHTGVLRDSMTHDFLPEPGVYFGTTTGDVYASTDLGGIWTKISGNLNRVQGVSALSL